VNLDPLNGLGAVRFGMTVKEVRTALRRRPRTFMKTAESLHATDAFHRLGLHVCYTSDGACEAVECFRPAKVIWLGRDLLQLGVDELQRLLTRHDPDAAIDADGIISRALGIAVYAPGREDDPSGKAEGVLVCREGYYDV